MTRLPSRLGTGLCAALASLFTWLHADPAIAGNCGCDHQITPGTTAVNGTALGIQPGHVVCVMAGDYEFIRFREIRGTAASPVIIKNCGGIVQVRNTDRAYAIDFQGSSRHFHLTGTGDAFAPYGFRVSAPVRNPYPGVGLWFLDKSTDYEVDHIEVYETGFAGVMSKTDPLCDGSADQGTFVQKNVHLHHLWVHDTGGEGLYIGSTQSNGHTITCNGQQQTRQPHYLEGIEVDHLLVEDTEWDGMQIGMAREGCSVHDNIIRRVGSAGVQYQQQGLQIGGYSACDIRRNILSDGPAIGVIVLGAYSTTVADNVIARFNEAAIYANMNITADGIRYRFVHNTILDHPGTALRVFGAALEQAVAWNNLIVGAPGSVTASNDVAWSAEGNLFVDTTAEAGFVDAARDDYHLVGTSSARGAGIDRSSEGFTLDLDGLLRATPPAVGAYEFAEDSPTSGAGGDGGANGNSGGAGGAGGAGGGPSGSGGQGSPGEVTDEGGCGCRTAGTPGSTTSLSSLGLAAGALLLHRIQRRRSARRRSAH
ncbi:right-handed parallel beta-helix repeat-containing protein [Chondromyces crocatus]|uniref:Uncharacterized protein n=1 Tax=Chondromyces crocatus TaxID=52 RepID=A0A0K1EL29_CHOCO|nr:right-handed parallel beta-helix repeat-containing protein [Chondromyces crocatus]AKT41564.1 uncharacterized protein CMC5_057710 [Chondromyces crocatus]